MRSRLAGLGSRTHSRGVQRELDVVDAGHQGLGHRLARLGKQVGKAVGIKKFVVLPGYKANSSSSWPT